MRVYILRRVLLMIPTVFFVSLLVFLMIRIIPGNVVDIMISQYGVIGTTTVIDRKAIEHLLGWDVPFLVQYGRWMGALILHGDLGNSLWKQMPVLEMINERWGVTLELGLLSIIVGQAIAIPIGILSALRQDTWSDYLGRSIAILAIAVPSFWVGTLVIVYPSIWWGYMPPLTLIKFTADPIGNLREFIVPAIILGMSTAGGTMRIMRTMMLEVLRQDYIRTAWAKGLRERTVVIRHALKNALIPIVTIIGYQLPVLVGGTVIIENIFSLPGMGRLMIDATTQRDYTVVSGIMVIFAVAMVLINLLIDLAYGYIDPRIQYK
jgi:peptide/nickel transport system permease protein